MKELLSLKEAANYLTISVSTLKRLIKSKKIPVVRFGKIYRIEKKDLIEFIEKNKI